MLTDGGLDEWEAASDPVDFEDIEEMLENEDTPPPVLTDQQQPLMRTHQTSLRMHNGSGQRTRKRSRTRWWGTEFHRISELVLKFKLTGSGTGCES